MDDHAANHGHGSQARQHNGHMAPASSAFPRGFIWGAGSSSYQVEGAVNADGRGPSVWDTLCTRAGVIAGGHTGDVACDHYHRFKDDVAMMKSIGLKSYRFSIAWPRVQPDGVGPANTKGLDFYRRLVDSLLDAGIRPFVTLYHWDMPQALQNRGGWMNRESVRWFSDYTSHVVAALSDRVADWITINEPQIYINLGHNQAKHAPGLTLSLREQLLATHHTLMAHGAAVMAIRGLAKKPARVGWAPVGRVDFPVDASHAESVDLARASTFSVDNMGHWNNTWFGDPVIFGHYPEDGLKYYGTAVPKIEPGDMELMKQPLDFYGLNIYSGAPVRPGATGKTEPVVHAPGHARNALSWPITPECLYWGPKFIHERYQLPIIITENGMTNLDWPDLDGQVKDPQRIDYTRRHLLALQRAIADGVPVTGYFHWSIMDNFEWAEGYKDRFGLIYVDFVTQERKFKDSAHWYRQVIATNGASLAPGVSEAMPTGKVAKA